MNRANYQLKRQAYIDEQLSLDETIELEESLSPTAKAELERERGFERALAERLNEPVPCHDEFWERLQKQIQAEAKPSPMRRFLGLPWLQLAACLAVALIVSLSAIVWQDSNGSNQTASTHPFLVPPPAVLREKADVPGDFTKVDTALNSNGFFLSVKAPPANYHHKVKLLGMRLEHEPNGKVAEVYFDCCDQPMIVFVFKAGSACSMGGIPISDIPRDYTVSTREVGKYKLVAIGKHDPSGVLGLFL